MTLYRATAQGNVPMTAEEEAAFVAQQAADAVATFALLKAEEFASYIENREKMCARVNGIGDRLERAGDTASALSCDAVVVGLLDVLNHASVTGATDIVALKLALKTRYLTAVSAATPAAILEFKKYDQ
jgi:hypothetical protein